MTDQQGTNRGNPYMGWLYVAGGLLVLVAIMIISAGSAATDRFGLVVLQIGGTALVGALIVGGITWRPKTAPYQPFPAGWYPDPNNHQMERWWDGQQWTDRVS